MALQLLARTCFKTASPKLLQTNCIQVLRALKPKNVSTDPFDLHPHKVKANVPKDTLIYDYANHVFFRNMTIFGFAQFFFWTYLTGFSYTSLRDVTPEEESEKMGLDKDSIPWWRKINLGTNLYRNGLASLCAIFGITVLGISVLYPSRAVKSLHLLKGGKQVRIQTYSIFKNSKDFSSDLESVSFLHSRQETKPQMAMKVQGRWLFFMLDKRGRFYRHDIFDYVVGLRRKF